MKINIIEKQRAIMSNPDSKHNFFGWPTIERLKDGQIVVGASGYRLSHICPFGKACVSFSKDNGKTYTMPMPVIDTVMDDRDVGLCAFGVSGLIVTSFTHTVSRSFLRKIMADGWEQCVGQNEREYVLSYLDAITDEEEEKYLASEFKISNDNGITFSKLYQSPITSPHGPIELRNGAILWVGENYKTKRIEAYTMFTDGNMEKVGEIAPVIENEKELWSCEPYAVQLSDETLVCHIRIGQDTSLFQSISKDNGKTWTVPVRILEPKGGAPSFMLEHSSGILICVYGYREKPYGIHAMFSKDGGVTWDKGYVVSDELSTADIGYPSITELEDKSLLMVFYAKDKTNNHTVIFQNRWSIEE